MGTEEASETQTPDEQSLIDFLYVDKERADSFISQIRNGTLRSVTRTTGTTEDSTFSVKGSAAVLQAKYDHANTSKAKAAEEYDPYHSQLIQLLNDLGVSPVTSLPEECAGKMLLLNSHIKVHDFESIRAILPVVSKHLPFFGLSTDKDTRNTIRLLNELIEQMSDSILLTMSIGGKTITGTLKETGLAISRNDIGRTYGVDLPGKWYVLGILDTIDDKIPTVSVDTIEDAIDVVSDAMSKFFRQSRYRMIPVLIFRTID
ncbi:MAG: hypothetical protein SOZ01_03090 [Selenomonadaceae bacterium]|nr:hypothetical protein [Selenomonadaceae bacterium]MDY3915714.1 hypothetical protein [Selenomonadaceae bacterium]